MFKNRFKSRTKSDPWISDRIRRYFSRRFTVGTNVPTPEQPDTRTHIVAELYETEMSYVDSLQIIVKKYMIPLKNSEHSTDHDKAQMDIIFYQVPELLKFHEAFLDSLKVRLRYWDTKHVIGDIFVDVFTRQELVDTYNEFINNWKAARDAVKSISAAKPAFARYLELASREHKGKLSLDALLIMPVQRIPRYELLLKELLKHTSPDHPDSKLLAQAANEVHDLAVKINKVEREAMQQEKRIQKLSDVEQLIDGISDLANGDHDFIQYDFVQIPGGLGMKKERCLFLFSDMLLITSVKKKGTGAIRKSSVAVSTSTSASLEGNKYKLLMKASLHDIDIIKTDVDEPCVRKYLKEVKSLKSDISTLEKINEMTTTLNNHYQSLDLAIKDVLSSLNQELTEKQSSGSQLMTLELAVHVNNDVEHLNILFSNPEQRMSWEASFLDAKDNLIEKSLYPEFLCSLPLEKTRPGMQITCAAATVESCQSGLPDVWICSSDGFVGQVSVLTFQNEPVISSCVNICNARILCIAAVPGVNSKYLMMRRRSTLLPYLPGFNYEKLKKSDMEQTVGKSISLDSDSDDEFIDAQDEDINEDANTLQPTMWLGTEDGCIFVYNCTDVKLQKARLRMHHSTCIYDIVHINDKVFISLANGEIIIYARDHSGLWNTCSPQKIHFGTNVSPISKMVLVDGKLWCSTLNSIAIIGTSSHDVQFTFPVGSDLMRHITAIVKSGFGMWIAVQSSPVIHLYHTTTYMHLLEINVTSAVSKLLNTYDEIIRQHKLVCLRVTALSIEKDTLWIGTSAGVVLSLQIPPLDSSTTEIDIIPNIIGIPHGHVGHVRFITNICATSVKKSSISIMSEGECSYAERKLPIANNSSALVISGGDGYEDFGNSDASNILGCGDSTNHLLMWKV